VTVYSWIAMAADGELLAHSRELESRRGFVWAKDVKLALSDRCDQHVKDSGNLFSDGMAMAVSSGIERNQEEFRCASIQPE
jgi:hypothetical protein